MQQRLVNRTVLVLVMLAISLLFWWIIKPFLLPIFLAALFAALFTPLYRWFLDRVGQREWLASLITLLTAVVFVFVPFGLVLGAVISQALGLADSALPWLQQQVMQPGSISARLEMLPFYDVIAPFREMVMSQIDEVLGAASKVVVSTLQSFTRSTVQAMISLAIVLYTMFFFLIDGDRLLYYLLYYLPLNDDDERKLLHRFTSVARATIKGTVVIGILQGGLAGLALWVAGVPSALFWAVAMMFMSVVPGVGTAIVWIPATIWLLATGDYVKGIALGVYCAVVVGSVDNLLRPKLVGSDTQLHELMIFFSTLGGLIVFGFSGFIIGPIIAALFVTVWELYGYEFKEWLPTTAFRPRGGEVILPHESLMAAERIASERAARRQVSTDSARTSRPGDPPEPQ